MSRNDSLRLVSAALLPVALCLVSAVRAGAQPPTKSTVAVQPDLIKREADSLSGFVDQLAAFDAKARAGRNARPTPAALADLTDQGARLKSAAPTVQRDVQSLIDKLQRAGKWTPDFDKLVLDRLRKAGADPRGVAEIESEGGPRAVLTTAQRSMASLPQDIDQDVKEASGRTVGGLRIACEPVYAGRLKCAIFFAAAVACGAIDAIPCAGIAAGKGIDCLLTNK